MKKLLSILSVFLISTSLFAIDDTTGIDDSEFFDISDSDISSKDLTKSFSVELDSLMSEASKLLDKYSAQLSKSAGDFMDYLGSEKGQQDIANVKNTLGGLFGSLTSSISDNIGSVPSQKSQKKSTPEQVFVKIDPTNFEKISEVRKNFLEYAESLRGIRYVSGGTSPSGFDCSGYVGYAAKNGIGVSLPRTAAQIYNSVQKIDTSDLEPGDLIFFKNWGNIDHIGIYAGKYQGSGQYKGADCFLNAANAGPRQGVVVSFLTEKYWKNHYCGAGRFIPATVNE